MKIAEIAAELRVALGNCVNADKEKPNFSIDPDGEMTPPDLRTIFLQATLKRSNWCVPRDLWRTLADRHYDTVQRSK